MQSKYAPHFDTLNDDEAAYFADSIHSALKLDQDHPLGQEITGHALYIQLVNDNVDHKTACMSLATDPSPMAVTILEKVVGNKIVREELAKVKPTRVAGAKVQGDGTPKPKIVKDDPRTIHNIKEGAKRPGSASYDRYMLYKEGMTVSEFIKAGGTAGDVKHDVSKGFITLQDPA